MAIEVAAAKATEEPREGRARQNARKAASQTVRMGERNLSSTLWKKWGWKLLVYSLSSSYGSRIGKKIGETHNSTVS